MYGTVARYKLKPGTEEKLAEFEAEMRSLNIPGMIAEYTFRMDNNPNEYFECVVFESEATYRALAESPEQDKRYRKLRALLETDPEWHDGEIVFSNVRAKKETSV